MTEGPERAVFTWKQFQQDGFEQLGPLLGDEWGIVVCGNEPAVEVFYRKMYVGNVLAIDPFHVEQCLGPHECTYIDPEHWNESCLSVTLKDQLFPDDVNPVDLEAAATILRGAVAAAAP